MDFKNILSKFQSLNESKPKGLYHNVNKRKKAGTSRPKGHPKAPTDQAWKDAAKTAKESTELDKSELSAQELAEKVYQKFNEIGSDMPFDIVSTEVLVDIVADRLNSETDRAVRDNLEAVVAELNKMSGGSTSWQFGTDDSELDDFGFEQNDFDMPLESKSESKEREYVCVHAKKYAPYECHAKTSREAAKKAAEHWGMKSTAGIDVYPAGELTAVNESETFEPVSPETEKVVAKQKIWKITVRVTKDSDPEFEDAAYQMYFGNDHHGEYPSVEEAIEDAKYEIREMRRWGLDYSDDDDDGPDPNQIDMFKESKPVNESLKDIFNRLSTELLGENQITMSPAQQNTQVIKKDDQVIGTVTNPGLASQLKRGIESGEVSLSQEMNEDSGHSILDIISPEELEELKGYVRGDLDEFDRSEVYKKLYDYYSDSPGFVIAGGDPDQWILDRVEHEYGNELSEGSQYDSDKPEEEISDEELLSMLSDKDSVSGSERDKERELLRNLYNMSKHEKELDETSMASMPNHDSDFGANLGAGRSSVTLEGVGDRIHKMTGSYGKMAKAARKMSKSQGRKQALQRADDFDYQADLYDYEGLRDEDGELKAHQPDMFPGAMYDVPEMEKDRDRARRAARRYRKIGQKESYMESRKLNEGAQQEIEAARLLGKAHGLKCQEYYGKTYENPEEARAYHEGYKEGLDECAGESIGMPHDDMSMDPSMAIAEPMADPMADPMDMPGDLALDLEEEETHENAFTSALANTEKGEKFTVGGKTFTNRTDIGEETFAFEAWDRELKGLLNEETNESVNEGMSVSISKGQQHTPDQVTVTASDSDADELMSLIKTAGLGMFGDEQPASDYGSPEVKHPEISDHDQMMSLIKSVDSHSDECNVCSEEEVEEAAPLAGAAVKAAARGAGSAVAHRAMDKMSEDEGGHDKGEYYVEYDDGYEGWCVFHTDDVGSFKSGHCFATFSDESEAQEYADKLNRDRSSRHKDNDEDFFTDKNWRERYGELEEDEDNDLMDFLHSLDEDEHYVEEEDVVSEELTEWANDAGKKGTDEAFEQDIEFMTKVISGGLNKQKQDQTTLPHTKVKVESESPDDWKKLAGIK